MAQNPAPELSADLRLPAFEDRLPDLVQVLREASAGLRSAHPRQSYLPFWEDAYAASHSLKGVLKILACPEDLGLFIVALNHLLSQGLAGPLVCRDLEKAARDFHTLAELLDSREPDIGALTEWAGHFAGLYLADQDHRERVRALPERLVYVDELVSKKAREATLLGFSQCAIEDHILLDDIPFWRTRLNEALVSEDFGRGLLVNFLPFLSSEGSRQLRVWAWVAAGTSNRAFLKQRIKEVLPQVQFTKL